MVHSTLVVGQTYFSVFYSDQKLTIPEIESLVYLGPDQTDTGAPLHLFQRAWSFHNEGNWNEMSPEDQREYDEPPLLSFAAGEMEPICDADGLLKELEAWRARMK